MIFKYYFWLTFFPLSLRTENKTFFSSEQVLVTEELVVSQDLIRAQALKSRKRLQKYLFAIEFWAKLMTSFLVVCVQHNNQLYNSLRHYSTTQTMVWVSKLTPILGFSRKLKSTLELSPDQSYYRSCRIERRNTTHLFCGIGLQKLFKTNCWMEWLSTAQVYSYCNTDNQSQHWAKQN